MAQGVAVHRWGRFEVSLELPLGGGVDALRDVQVVAELTAPSGRRRHVPGFWDGDNTYRVRFAPDELGVWRYSAGTHPGPGAGATGLATYGEAPSGNASTAPVAGAAWEARTSVSGTFECVSYEGDNPLYRHGRPRMAPNRRHLVHADGTPLFWLADTVWNGPMLATPEEWEHFVRTRVAQGFTAAQYVSTQYRTVPDGGPDGPPYTGDGHIEAVRPSFFRRLDARLETLAEAGLIGVPVLLWAISGGENNFANPGHVLSEADCILLARYQVALWHAHPVVWILNGDGRYTGEHAPRWQRIGRAVFASIDPNEADPSEAETSDDRVPVAVHPGGRQWVGEEFGAEPWLDILGYQSGHGGDEASWRWLAEGDPARRWPEVPRQAVINLEPCYEYHNRTARGTEGRFTAQDVRRALYWSLLITPTAGVTYGGHGIWGWDDGSGPPVAHPYTGTPLHWRQALEMPGAQQVRHVHDAFSALPWWTLQPDRSLLRQPPEATDDILAFVPAARSEDGRLAVLYLPRGGAVTLDTSSLAPGRQATWINPRDGTRVAGPALGAGSIRLDAPDGDDWLLVLQG
ncbi:MAG: DUF4038 domain-containing protein [Chloroflexota bacterium]|nr:DUF4038 domain-containing protein [Chloroflexota bacterium]